MRFLICCVITGLCFEVFSVEALKTHDAGVCTVKTSERKFRVKSYLVKTNKMCSNKKKCVVRKTKKEPYTVTRNNTVCCNGWEYNSNTDSCSPLCSTGCAGGRCVKPETCQCDPPMVHHPQHKNTCVMSVCDPPCVNAECYNQTCQCVQDYQQFNTTHCYRCDPGYKINGKYKCVPYCDKCVNGKCTAPNKCTCDKDYKLVNGTCEPVCKTCVNSVCVAPNECKCLEGFVKIGDDCVPKCNNCVNGKCNALNECECLQGYAMIDGICKAVCKKECKHGYCSAPETCTCDEGFVRNETTNTCYKPCQKNCEACDEEGTCILNCVPVDGGSDNGYREYSAGNLLITIKRVRAK